MKCNLYFAEEFWNKVKQKAKKKGLSASAYIRMTIMKSWREEE